MRLSQDQIETYRRNGFLVIEGLFSSAELDILAAALPSVFSEDSVRRVLERDGGVRSVFASHRRHKTFDCFSRLKRLVEPAAQIVESEVYIHQLKVNAKAALGGERWEWHQDFLYWHKEDRMPEPRVVTAVLFMQDINEFNGPMLVLPGPHHGGMIDLDPEQRVVAAALAGVEPSWASTLTADLKYKVSRSLLARLVAERGIEAVTLGAGGVMFFHGNLFHASPNNLSPWDRVSIFVSYNSVKNPLELNGDPRPDYIAARDFSPIQSLSDESLMQIGGCAG